MAKKLKGIRLPHLKGTQLCETIIQDTPKKVVLPMAMSMGTEADISVNIGDYVFVGQKIAQSSGALSLPIHASVSGRISAIGEMRLVNGNKCKTVEIDADGEQKLCPDIKPPQINDKNSFIDAVKESGICGLGGAGFPTYIKLSPKNEIDTLIINAAECEPYITSDCREIIEHIDDVISGIELVLKWLGIEKCFIAIEANKPEAILALREKLENSGNISVFILPESYPQGAEKVVIHTVTKRVVKAGMLPSDVGVIVLNVSTASQIKRYCDSGIPLIKRRITVEGDCVSNPCNIEAYIGTSARELFELADTNFSKASRIIFGGPMMGIAKASADAPITKTTNAILALSREDRKVQTACIRCARCISACPLKLMPTQIEKAYRANDIDALKKLNVMLCMNCGSCSYVCPAGRNLAEINQLAKSVIPKG